MTALIDVLATQEVDSRELWLRRRASDRFKKEVVALGWTVHETVDLEPSHAASSKTDDHN